MNITTLPTGGVVWLETYMETETERPMHFWGDRPNGIEIADTKQVA